jgi:hypothetical protein
MKTVFLQFFKEESYLYTENFIVNYLNGLSYVWNELKNKGEMIWKHVDDETTIITEGTIYASVWYTKSLRILYNWAKQFPKLEVYVCGPLILHYDLSFGKDLKNFHVNRQNAEDLLCNGKISDWNIEIPKTTGSIGYSVALTNGIGCYWGKCRYCKIIGPLKYRDIDKIPVIEHDGLKCIWLHTYSLPPHFIKKFYPQFEDRDDVRYATYVRGDKHITKALKETIPLLSVDPKYLGFDVGIEFPTDKMLQYMDKGTTVEEYLNFIKVAASNDIQLHFNLILGWKQTDYDDLKGFEYFLNELSKSSKPNSITVNIYPLTIVQDRKVRADYTIDEIETFKSDYDVFIGMPKQSETQKHINSEIRKLIHNYPFRMIHDLADPNSTWRKNSYGMIDDK